MTARTDALAYHRDLSRLSGQAAAIALRSWRRVDRADISGSWRALLPDILALLIGAQIVAAELADPYLADALGDGPDVDPGGYAGMTTGGVPVGDLLYLPVIDAKQHIAAGSSAAGALRQSSELLQMYMRSTVADTGRLAVSAGMGARPHSSGYYRMLVPPSCPRCAILAGRWYRWNSGFRRHPRCDCVHIPVQETDDSHLFDARKAIEQGQVHGLSEADRRAIVDYGANPAQVVNATQGMYTAYGGRSFTTTATTRKGVAGARILRRDMDRILGRPTTGTYRNFGFDRYRAQQYSELLRKGKTYTRLTRSGRRQTYSYRYANTPRPTPETILADARTREDAVRLLTNYGYIH